MICQEENCEIRAYYNLPTEKTPIYCNQHRKQYMIDVKHKKCIEINCNTRPTYNLLNEKIPIYCCKHKKNDMINITEKRKCIEINCNTRPTYNLLNEKIPIYCGKHKKNDMIDIVSKRCIENNCNTQPNYNLPNETTPIYCAKHKKLDMIDIINKRCIEINCNTLPNYNLPNEKIPIYCAKHKKLDMIDIKNTKCIEINCNTQPSCNLPNEKIPIYCTKHKKLDMINIISKRCIENNCDILSTNKYKGYCLRCFIYLFPDEKISKNYKVKEQFVVNFIKETFKDIIFTFDKTVGGCSKRRPDAYIDLLTHVLIIECDENQHTNYSCENKRIMELFTDFNSRPIVFIRFNPDAYINEDGNKILSSFKYHKSLDIPMIRNKDEWENRLKILKENIEKWLINIPEKEITNEFLFYDHCE